MLTDLVNTATSRSYLTPEQEAELRDHANRDVEHAIIGEPVESPDIIYEIRLDNETAALIG
jgi:hypothetical protein